MVINSNYKPPMTGAGELRIPVYFYQYAPDKGPEPGQSKKKVLHECMCEAYNPSMKDIAIMDTKGTKQAVTIKIRDTAGDYIPSNKHFAQLDDYYFEGRVFEIIDVRPDLKDRRFVIVLLGGVV